MGRPKITDRAIADENISIRLTKPERQALKDLCALRAAEIEGTGAVITEAGILRALLVREVKAVLGGLPTLEPETKPAVGRMSSPTETPEPPKVDSRQLEIPTATPSDAVTEPTSKKNVRVMTEQAVRARLKRALDGKTTTATDIASATGTYAALVARWVSGKDAFGDKLETVNAALEALRR